MKDKITKLIDVKSILTFMIAGTMVVLALKGRIEANKTYEMALMVVAYFFGVKRNTGA